jgi:hypothetical protein
MVRSRYWARSWAVARRDFLRYLYGSERLQPGRNDDAVADQIVALRHHLPLMHADPQP